MVLNLGRGGKWRGGASWVALAAALLLVMSASRSSTSYDFDLKEVNTGQELTLQTLTDGKPLVLHVWSPECPHCQRHMPYLVGLYKKLDLDKVNFATISVAESRRSATDYINERHLEFPVLYGSGGKMSDALTAKGWPTTFVFAPGGDYVGYCDNQGASYIGEVLDLVDTALSK